MPSPPRQVVQHGTTMPVPDRAIAALLDLRRT
jgi:hypothetical protein